MIIGIDFDNTIVDYTGVFHAVALELGWIPATIGQSKTEVKQYFIENNMEIKWTELQGLVYGKYIHHAKPYPDCLSVLQQLKKTGAKLYLISHKTKSPFIGEKIDLHSCAVNWLINHGFLQTANAPFSATDIHFNEKKEQKIKRIADLSCHVFIDDLPEILNDSLFPSSCTGILFSPGTTSGQKNIVHSWLEFNNSYA